MMGTPRRSVLMVGWVRVSLRRRSGPGGRILFDKPLLNGFGHLYQHDYKNNLRATGARLLPTLCTSVQF